MTDIIEILKALSSEPRLKLFTLLKGRSLCVNAITAKMGMTQSAVSQHLKILKGAGLVTARRDGYRIHYEVDQEALVKHSRQLASLFDLD